MANETSRLKEALLQAIQAEGDGHNFYRMAAMTTRDDKGREVFEMLAREEAAHAHFLRSQYTAVLETGHPDKAVKLPRQGTLEEVSPIFSPDFKSRIKGAHLEMSSLSIGIQLELSAIKFYREQRELAVDPDVKSFFSELMEWESGHYNALNRQLESVKEDYWTAGGFQPF